MKNLILLFVFFGHALCAMEQEGLYGKVSDLVVQKRYKELHELLQKGPNYMEALFSPSLSFGRLPLITNIVEDHFYSHDTDIEREKVINLIGLFLRTSRILQVFNIDESEQEVAHFSYLREIKTNVSIAYNDPFYHHDQQKMTVIVDCLSGPPLEQQSYNFWSTKGLQLSLKSELPRRGEYGVLLIPSEDWSGLIKAAHEIMQRGERDLFVKMLKLCEEFREIKKTKYSKEVVMVNLLLSFDMTDVLLNLYHKYDPWKMLIKACVSNYLDQGNVFSFTMPGYMVKSLLILSTQISGIDNLEARQDSFLTEALKNALLFNQHDLFCEMVQFCFDHRYEFVNDYRFKNGEVSLFEFVIKSYPGLLFNKLIPWRLKECNRHHSFDWRMICQGLFTNGLRGFNDDVGRINFLRGLHHRLRCAMFSFVNCDTQSFQGEIDEIYRFINYLEKHILKIAMKIGDSSILNSVISEYMDHLEQLSLGDEPNGNDYYNFGLDSSGSDRDEIEGAFYTAKWLKQKLSGEVFKSLLGNSRISIASNFMFILELDKENKGKRLNEILELFQIESDPEFIRLITEWLISNGDDWYDIFSNNLLTIRGLIDDGLWGRVANSLFEEVLLGGGHMLFEDTEETKTVFGRIFSECSHETFLRFLASCIKTDREFNVEDMGGIYQLVVDRLNQMPQEIFYQKYKFLGRYGEDGQSFIDLLKGKKNGLGLYPFMPKYDPMVM